MPLKQDKTAFSQFEDKSTLQSTIKKLHSTLAGFVCNNDAIILGCTKNAQTLSVPRGTRTLFDFIKDTCFADLKKAFLQSTDTCVELKLRKSAYATVEYSGNGLFICYIFAETKSNALTLADELMTSIFALEYVRTLNVENQAHKDLLLRLEKQHLHLKEYSKFQLEAYNSSNTTQTNINVFLSLLIDCINESGNALKVKLNYNSTRQTIVQINNDLFAKFFCASVAFLAGQTQSECIPVDITAGKDNFTTVCLIAGTVNTPQSNAYLRLLYELAPKLGWSISVTFDPKLSEARLFIKIPTAGVTPHVLHSTLHYPPLSDFFAHRETKASALALLVYI